MAKKKQSATKCPLIRQGRQSLLSAVFYIVIVGLYVSVAYEKAKGGFADLVAWIRSPEGLFSAFAFAFYSKVFCDDVREERSDDKRAIPALLLAWLFFLLQVALWREPVFSAISFIIGVLLIAISEHTQGVVFDRRMLFNLIYAVGALIFASSLSVYTAVYSLVILLLELLYESLKGGQ